MISQRTGMDEEGIWKGLEEEQEREREEAWWDQPEEHENRWRGGGDLLQWAEDLRFESEEQVIRSRKPSLQDASVRRSKLKQEIEDEISKIGAYAGEDIIPQESDRYFEDMRNRLRIIEEDRDVLQEHVLKLQRIVDNEKQSRQQAEKEYRKTKEALEELDKNKTERQKESSNKLSQLEGEVKLLKMKHETAQKRGAAGPSVDVLDSLKQRTLYMEDVSNKKAEMMVQKEKEMIRALGITFKVLQLQKDHSEKISSSESRIASSVDKAETEGLEDKELRHFASAREVQHLACQLIVPDTDRSRVNVLYDNAGRRSRELFAIRNQTIAYLDKV
eukprot:755107-Hanusia_phi.AAC.5